MGLWVFIDLIYLFYKATKKELNRVLFGFEEGRRMILKNIMQGELQEDGNYRWKVRKEHAMGTRVKQGDFTPEDVLEQLKELSDKDKIL